MVQIVLRHILSHGIHIIRDLDLIGTKVQIKSRHFSTDSPKITVLMVMRISRYTAIIIHYNGCNAFDIHIKYILHQPAHEMSWCGPHLARPKCDKFYVAVVIFVSFCRYIHFWFIFYAVSMVHIFTFLVGPRHQHCYLVHQLL